MGFPVKDTFTEEETESGLRSVIKDGLATQAMVTLTGGVFLVAFALKLGASYTLIGLLAAIPPLAQLIQIPSISLVEKYRVRRTISMYASAGSRIFLLLIALIPFLFSIEIGLIFLIVFLSLHAMFAAIGGCSWNSWMRDLIPQNQLGAFFAKRAKLTIGLAVVLSLAAGFFIDQWVNLFPNYELYGYSILFFGGFIVGLFGIYFISTIPEPRMVSVERGPKFFEMISQPFKNVNFKNLVMFLGFWNFAINLAAPFFTVYMLIRLELHMSFVIIFLVLS